MTQATAERSLEPLTESGETTRLQQAVVRVRQFVHGLRADVHEADLAHASSLLPHAAYGLFLLMPVDAQRHSLNVLDTLEHDGTVSRDLAAAALLHDMGKLAAAQAGHPITLWVRGPLVLLDALAPALARRLANDNPARRLALYALCARRARCNRRVRGLRRPAVRRCTCWLIEHHQDVQVDSSAEPEALADLVRLQAADARH